MKKILFLLIVAMLVPVTVGAQEGRVYDNFGNSEPLSGFTTQASYYSGPGCPLCGSEGRMYYGDGDNIGDAYLVIDKMVFYVCANCGNVYAKEEVKKP